MPHEDPYQAPRSELESSTPPTSVQQDLATAGRRFANLLIDTVAVQASAFVVGSALGVAIVVLGGSESSFDAPGVELLLNLAGVVVAVAYYVLLEAIFGRTLGKLLTGTRVVDLAGKKPSFGRVIGRTLCRLIPFDAFSFLGGNPGWHDTISKTRVVRVR